MQCVMSQTTVIVSLCDLCKKYCLQYEKTPFLAKKPRYVWKKLISDMSMEPNLPINKAVNMRM